MDTKKVICSIVVGGLMMYQWVCGYITGKRVAETQAIFANSIRQYDSMIRPIPTVDMDEEPKEEES